MILFVIPRSPSPADPGEQARECKGKTASPEKEVHVDSDMGSGELGLGDPASSSISISMPTSDIDRHEKNSRQVQEGARSFAEAVESARCLHES